MKGRYWWSMTTPPLAEMLGIVLRGEGFEPSFVADGARAVTASGVPTGRRPLDLMLRA